ncbi:SPASM domain peptide maturase, grasp-with-spasm system [Tenacibaculum sp. MAR_2009_124]|uniref:grasp-with-spasm system SPASM domain peptide maturase n=1 Tax=Tenacibaculum sp. MAR_2009_124 TaxID=1250059 RepID=UPI00089D6518|nr:grasp-with-spasm system SPASM domain peptide maturase [Tenacibaculum sp. MAR_2009_124]SEC64864.1 SPASM domain peptide maturase, grasp-with-spasm system [Tenacibaculum sp. MAR_2009_124]
MRSEKNYFQLFSNCILVKGANRATINDLQRNDLFIISNQFCDIIEGLNAKLPITELKKEYSQEDIFEIDKTLEFLESKEYGFFCDIDDFSLFPKLDTAYKSHCDVTNIILEKESFSLEKIQKTKDIINSTLCESIVILCYFKIDEDQLLKITSILNNTTLRSLELVIPYNKNIDSEALKRIRNQNTKLSSITFYNSPDEWNIDFNINLFSVSYRRKNIDDFSFCGSVNKKDFNVNKEKFLESLNYNSCLYKKLAIDRKGNIKNCPAFKNDFGNIKTINTKKIKETILSKNSFKSVGLINKDSIEVCKDCEFRHVCTDCRAYLSESSNIKSKPLKCGYNPYNNTWFQN